MLLFLYVILLGALALFTAYTRNFQRTIVAIGEQVGSPASASVAPRAQGRRTMALIVCWPLAFGIGLAFVAWWKAVALVVGAFLVLIPVLGAFTPRSFSRHYIERIRADLERRLAQGVSEEPQLREILHCVDRLGDDGPT